MLFCNAKTFMGFLYIYYNILIYVLICFYILEISIIYHETSIVCILCTYIRCDK